MRLHRSCHNCLEGNNNNSNIKSCNNTGSLKGDGKDLEVQRPGQETSLDLKGHSESSPCGGWIV